MIQTVTDKKHTKGIISLDIQGQSEGHIALHCEAVGCSNKSCLKTSIAVVVGSAFFYGQYNRNVKLTADSEPLFRQQIRPQGLARPQPNYIPAPIREDYYEAALIRDLSAKASATLIRRCLQGMIRDFAGIAKGRLIDEIKALRKAVDDGTADRAVSIESIDAIDRVRGIGNIGAHMEKDINQIVEVDPGEAQALIELVEMLFEEWYTARERRQTRLARIESISEAKKAAKDALPENGVPGSVSVPDSKTLD